MKTYHILLIVCIGFSVVVSIYADIKSRQKENNRFMKWVGEMQEQDKIINEKLQHLSNVMDGQNQVLHELKTGTNKNLGVYNMKHPLSNITMYPMVIGTGVEKWIIAKQIGGSILVKWQEYPSATEYRIYKKTENSEQLIYKGVEFSYTDSNPDMKKVNHYEMRVLVHGKEISVDYTNRPMASLTTPS